MRLARIQLVSSALVLAVVAAGVGPSCGPRTRAVQAQEQVQTPQAIDEGSRLAIEDMMAAFEELASLAASGDWQAADLAYNGALDALDRGRAVVEASLGESAVSAFARVDGYVPAIVAGLDEENAISVKAAVAQAVSELAALLPGAAAPEDAGVALTVLDWRSRVDAILALADAGSWRDAEGQLPEALQRFMDFMNT